MPLNMNTIGTGTGIGSNSETSVSAMLVPQSTTETPMNMYPAYVTDYSDIIPNNTTGFKKAYGETSKSGIFVNIFTFKNDIYGVSTRTYSDTAYRTVTVSKLNIINGSSMSREDIFEFNYLNYTSGTRVTNYVIPGKKYMYYIKMYYYDDQYTYNGVVSTCSSAYVCRHDGITEEVVKPLFIGGSNHPLYNKDLSTEYLTGYYENIECFNMLDAENDVLLLGYGRKYIRLYINDVFRAEAYTSPNPITPKSSYTDYFKIQYTVDSQSYSTNFDNFAVIHGKCIKSNWVYLSSWMSHLLTFDFIDNDGESFTISNISYRHTYGIGGRINMCDTNLYTLSSVISSGGWKVTPPMFFYYNYKTSSIDLIERDWSNNFGSNGSTINSGIAGNHGSAIAFVDRNNDRIVWTIGSDESSSTPQQYVYTQPCNINYVSGYSDTSYSKFSAYLRKGDIVYCSSNITNYIRTESSNSVITISNPSKKFIIQKDGTYELRSVHGDGTYIPSWIAIDGNGGIIYLKFYKISSTQIHGWFIPGMTVNETAITTDGEQTLTLNDFTINGIIIDMKGVK